MFLDGGDRPSLTPSAHNLVGSTINGNSRWVYAMCPAVFLGGVNQTVHSTTISHHPHISVWVQGNDHTFQENNVSDVCTYVRRRLCVRHGINFMLKPKICQDRLGTNIGTVEKRQRFCCRWALDSGALYSGRDYTYRGNRVINNRFEHIRSHAGDDTQAV